VIVVAVMRRLRAAMKSFENVLMLILFYGG
jgi:hypothetical protein